jgi:uncharacterized protein YjbJ (UPF0337 family)
MLNPQVMEGNWNTIKGKVREKWGQITDNELEAAKGKGDQLVGTIQRKTGESRDQIERFLDELTASGASTVARGAEAARGYAHQAMDEMQRFGEEAKDSIGRTYDQAESMIRARPGQSLALAFGLGVVAGLMVGVVCQRH